MSRWSNWSRGTKPGRSLQDFLNEGPVDQLRTGNPTGNGTVSPADRAKQLGLQSNGKGGYIDPKSGQIVARTVNNELVFYSTGPTGGAISDGSGGADMARPSSSWQDPITGMMVTPPGKPETPNELAAIPDAVPAVAPAGYNEFIQRQKQQMYANDFKARENAKIQDQMPQQPEVAPETDPGAMMQPADPAMSMENYLPVDLLKRTGGMGPPTFSDLRDRVKRAQQVTPPESMVPSGASGTVDAQRGVVASRDNAKMGIQKGDRVHPDRFLPARGEQDTKANKDAYIKKASDYLDNIVQTKDKIAAPSEREFDKPGAERQQRIDLDSSGFFGEDGELDPEVVEFMQNARSSGEFQKALKRQRARRERRIADAKEKLEFNDDEAKRTINQFIKRDNKDYRKGSERNERGRGTEAEREENAVLEVLYQMHQTGERIQNLDGTYNQDLLDLARSHFLSGAKDQAREGVRDPKQDGSVISALKTAQAIKEKMNEMGYDYDELAFGKDGGQSTNIPDRFRSNLYDDVLSSVTTELAKFTPEYNTPNTKRGRAEKFPDTNGHSPAEVEKMGKQLMASLYGYDVNAEDEEEDEEGGKKKAGFGSLMDAVQSGDIYWNRRGINDEVLADIAKAAEMYRGMQADMPDTYDRTEEDLADLYNRFPNLAGSPDAPKLGEGIPNQFKQDIPHHFMMEIKRQLAQRMKDGDLIPQSLKKVNVPTTPAEVGAKPIKGEMVYNPKINPENSSLNDVYEFLGQDLDNPKFNFSFIPQAGKGANKFFGTRSMGLDMGDNTMRGQWTDQGLPDEDGDNTPVPKKKYAKMLAQMRSDSDQLKFEPTYQQGSVKSNSEDPGNQSNLAARFGAAPLSVMRRLMKEKMGHDFDYMLPRGGSGGHKVKKKDKGKDQEPFTDEQRQYWGDMIERLAAPYEGSQLFALDPKQLSMEEDAEGNPIPMDPREYVNKLIDLANLDPEKIQSDEHIFDRSDIHPSATKYDKYQSRKRIQSTLKNLHLMDYFRKLDLDRDEKYPDGKFKRTLFDILAQAGKLNRSPEDLALPRWGIS